MGSSAERIRKLGVLDACLLELGRSGGNLLVEVLKLKAQAHFFPDRVAEVLVERGEVVHLRVHLEEDARVKIALCVEFAQLLAVVEPEDALLTVRQERHLPVVVLATLLRVPCKPVSDSVHILARRR